MDDDFGECVGQKPNSQTAFDIGAGSLDGVAQLVEHRTHKPGVGSSILPSVIFKNIVFKYDDRRCYI